MILRQFALVRREIWEHRSLYITPAVIGLIMVLTLLTAFVFASGYQEMIDIGIVGAQNLAAESPWRQRIRQRDATGRATAREQPNWNRYPYPFIDGKFDSSLFPIAEWRDCMRQAMGKRRIQSK